MFSQTIQIAPSGSPKKGGISSLKGIPTELGGLNKIRKPFHKKEKADFPSYNHFNDWVVMHGIQEILV